MEIISNTALISINETLIIQVLSFLIFLFVINRLMFRPLRKTIGDREKHFEKIGQEIDQAKEDIERYSSQIEDRKNAVRDEAFAIAKELENTGNQEANKIVDAVRKEVSGLRENTDKEIEAQIFEAKKNVQNESKALAIHIMEKVLDRRLSNEAV